LSTERNPGETENFKIAPTTEPQFLFLLSFCAFLELAFSGLARLLIAPNPKSALLFGFSVLRLLQVWGIWIIAILILSAGFTARNRKMPLDSILLDISIMFSMVG